MKKSFKLANLDCANCASKMELAIGSLEGVEKTTISFMSERLTLECSEEALPSLLDEAQKCISKIHKATKIIV